MRIYGAAEDDGVKPGRVRSRSRLRAEKGRPARMAEGEGRKLERVELTRFAIWARPSVSTLTISGFRRGRGLRLSSPGRLMSRVGTNGDLPDD